MVLASEALFDRSRQCVVESMAVFTDARDDFCTRQAAVCTRLLVDSLHLWSKLVAASLLDCCDCRHAGAGEHSKPDRHCRVAVGSAALTRLLSHHVIFPFEQLRTVLNRVGDQLRIWLCCGSEKRDISCCVTVLRVPIQEMAWLKDLRKEATEM